MDDDQMVDLSKMPSAEEVYAMRQKIADLQADNKRLRERITHFAAYCYREKWGFGNNDEEHPQSKATLLRLRKRACTTLQNLGEELSAALEKQT